MRHAVLCGFRRSLVYAARNWDIKSLDVIGVPYCGGQKKVGTELGPQILRQYGLMDTLKSRGCNPVDMGDLKMEMKQGQSLEECGRASKQVFDAVRKSAERHHFVLTLGGDHSIATGTVAAFLDIYPDLNVIWIDAHADINTPSKSSTSSVHGMPLSFVTQGVTIQEEDCKHHQWARKRLLPSSSLHYVGLRDLDSFEKITIERNKIPEYDANFVSLHGIKTVIEKIEPILKQGKPILVSFDVDSIDPDHTPCTGTPVLGGLTLREAITLTRHISNSGHVVGLDIVEINPKLKKHPGDEEKTVNSALEIIKQFL